jgi:hypothetical protein
MQIFQFLTKNEEKTSVFDAYNNPQSYFVIRDDGKNYYIVFDDVKEFIAWQDNIPLQSRNFHEVIFGEFPQRIKFDVDAIGCDQKTIREILDQLIQVILDELYNTYKIEWENGTIQPTLSDILVTTSTGAVKGVTKFSYHIIVMPFYLIDNVEAQNFTTKVISKLKNGAEYIDQNVNKSIQNFRLLGSMKTGSSRPKIIYSEINGTATDIDLESSLIAKRNSWGVVLPRRYETQEKKKDGTLKTDGKLVRKIMTLASETIKGHEFQSIHGTLLCFRRLMPTFCKLCAETHHKDNSLMLGVYRTEPEKPWDTNSECELFEYCRQKKGNRKYICNIDIDEEILAEVIQSNILSGNGGAHARHKEENESLSTFIIQNHLELIEKGKHNPHCTTLFETASATSHIYSESSMMNYKLSPSLGVSAQMKLGKTKALTHFINENFSESTAIIRFISFRITFSSSLKESFTDFTLYNEILGDITQGEHPRLIIQVESLHRLKINEGMSPVDLLVLDESESILSQFNSGLHKNFNAAFAAFQWMMKTAKHVICMDANISDRTYNTMKLLRPQHPINFHWNQYKKASTDIYYFIANKKKWLAKLHLSIAEGQKIVIPLNSLSEGKTLEQMLINDFPTKKIKLYCSETTMVQKREHFGNVHKYWSELDVLIFTPTCSAGVSFELKHFDTLFGYFCDRSCDVETCRQMIGRVRNLSTNTHYICLQGSPLNLPVEIQELRKVIYDKRNNLYKKIDSLHFEYEDDGGIKFHETKFFNLFLENIRIANISRNNFITLFIDQTADSGAKIHYYEGDDNITNVDELFIEHQDVKNKINDSKHQSIASSPELIEEEALIIKNNMEEQIATQQEIYAYEKYKLRKIYEWTKPIQLEFVADYLPYDTKIIYKNLTKIMAHTNIRQSLVEIQCQEQNHHMAIHQNDNRDLLNDRIIYKFQRHYLATWLIFVCGFNCITDPSMIHEEVLESRLRSVIHIIQRHQNQITSEFKIRFPKLEKSKTLETSKFLETMIKFINSILRVQYDISIKRISKKLGGDAFMLKKSNLFTINDDNLEKPNVNSKLILFDSDVNVNIFIERQLED